MPGLQTNDIETYYETGGEGPVVIMIHGAWIDSNMWKFQKAALDDDFQWLVYDIRGHGKTPFGEKEYTFDQLAEDLKALMDGLGIEKASIVGVSQGGMVAQTFACHYSERVEKLVLCSTALSFELGLIEKMLKYVVFPIPVFRMVLRIMGVSLFARFAFRVIGLRTPKSAKKRKKIQGNTKSYAREQLESFAENSFAAIMEAVYSYERQPVEELPHPVLLVWGERDSFLTHRQVAAFQKVLRSPESREIKKASHVPPMEKPNAFNKALIAFLKK